MTKIALSNTAPAVQSDDSMKTAADVALKLK